MEICHKIRKYNITTPSYEELDEFMIKSTIINIYYEAATNQIYISNMTISFNFQNSY